jgi:CheY-like chemotaxis protein
MSPVSHERASLACPFAFHASSPSRRGALADDEEAIRWLGRRFLEADGWIVYQARDGEEALEIVESSPERAEPGGHRPQHLKVSGRELAEVLSVVEKRRRARRLRELTPAAQADLRAAVRTLRMLDRARRKE